ncbi:OmpH family outer membrane protein [Yoonia sp. R2-816]|uniref:OmpH family outer membrane protein n=1 Tax=Yoonia sp. R2-816 TaxID=3342638 RepID=UPI00372C3ED2
MRFLGAIAVWFVLALSGAAQAQGASPQVLIIDSERLYEDTLYGRRLDAELASLMMEFQAENDRIAATLREEELSLTERRPGMTREAFQAEAAAFDAKVQEVRRARDAKNLELQAVNRSARATFESRVQNIVADVMIERGAALVMEQDNVVMSIRAVNITDDVIVRIDAQLGDGTR